MRTPLKTQAAAQMGNRGREGGVSMGVLLCSSGTDAFPYLLPGEKQTLAAYMKGSFPAAWRRNRAIIEFERGRKVWDRQLEQLKADQSLQSRQAQSLNIKEVNSNDCLMYARRKN